MELVKGMNTFVNDFLYVVEMKMKVNIKAAELETKCKNILTMCHYSDLF